MDRREARETAEREEYERNNPKIQQQFTDLKRALGTVTDDDWANLPEVGDLTGKNRRVRQNLRQRFYAVPDSVLIAARDSGQMGTSVAEDGTQTSNDQADGTMTNFKGIGEARNKAFQVQLSRAAVGSTGDPANGSGTTIDPKGYLTSLAQSEVKAIQAQVGDYKRNKGLFESVTKTNPTHAPGWIAAARHESEAGKIVQARKVIAKGCEFCPHSEDAWLFNMYVNENHNAKIIAANAIRNNPQSITLWVEAMGLESDPRAKKRVLRLALDQLPQSVVLWKEAVNLEGDPADAKLMLAKATEIIPQSIDLWLALARLETFENAQKVLNKARRAIPTSHEIWIAAARLQEQHGDFKDAILVTAVRELARNSAMLKREEWIAEAERCEREGAPLTCQAIIRHTFGHGLDEDDDRRELFMDDGRASTDRGCYETARAMYAYALKIFYDKKAVWLAAADLERNHGTRDALWQTLEKAVEACPHSDTLWMMLAKEKWKAGELDEARKVLGRAFERNKSNEDIWLAAVKLEAENNETEKARELLSIARQEAGTDRVWIKSVAFERQAGDLESALNMVNQALVIYPSAAKLWMQKGQIYENLGQTAQAREAYNTGCRVNDKSMPLWILAARLEENSGAVVKARSVLDRARLAVPKDSDLWVESIRIERRAGNTSQAQQLMSKALQERPDSGLLWSERIWYLEKRTQRKSLALQAMKLFEDKQYETDPTLCVTVARMFWQERKLEKAARWFEKAIVLDPDVGDSFAWYLKFLDLHGTPEKIEDILGKAVANEPRHGEVWQRVNKDPGNAGRGIEEVLQLVKKALH